MTTGHLPAKDVVPATWVAIDIAKDAHAALIESAKTRRSLRIANTLESMERFLTHLHALPQPVRIGFEPTGVYHRPLAYRSVTAGFDVCLVSSLTCARYREARYTWTSTRS